MQTCIYRNIILKIELRQNMILPCTFYEEYYILNILFIFAYHVHSLRFFTLKIL